MPCSGARVDAMHRTITTEYRDGSRKPIDETFVVGSRRKIFAFSLLRGAWRMPFLDLHLTGVRSGSGDGRLAAAPLKPRISLVDLRYIKFALGNGFGLSPNFDDDADGVDGKGRPF